ncbi:MAG: YggS family pyridoxal phosphate-dependent enzyme [Deltaproteobacteria bacterium]
MSIADNLKSVRDRIRQAAQRAGRAANEITLVAVSKGVSAESIAEAARHGSEAFGENYAQELRAKQTLLEREQVGWHFIGRLQRNKVKYVVGRVKLIHSLADFEVAVEISRRAEKLGRGRVPVLVEINIAGDVSKDGIAPGEADGFVGALGQLPMIEPRGFMAMPPFSEDAEASRGHFRRLRALRDSLREKFRDLSELSMGMSGDFEVAIEEGATMVRVGSAIFGAREMDKD